MFIDVISDEISCKYKCSFSGSKKKSKEKPIQEIVDFATVTNYPQHIFTINFLFSK